jgi:hypothetical protein
MLTTKALSTLSLLLTLSCAAGAAATESAALCSAAAAPARPAEEGCAEAPAPAGLQSKLFHQLRYHQRFPATRAQLLAGLRAAAELDAAETAWIAERLPALPLPTAREAMVILFPAAPTAGLALLETRATVAQR